MSPRQVATAPDIPGFRYLGQLGSGGFADVFSYEQVGLGGRTVAVKVLTTDLLDNSLAAFQAEASVMAKLSNHPSIVSIYGAGAADDGRAYLLMEQCQPESLSVRMRAKPLSVGRALETTIQVAGAVESAHRLGVLHRDIKPANILYTEYGRPALTDFGISVTTDDGSRGVGAGMSPAWSPPEQLSAGTPMTPASDVYSLAATCWAMLVGRSPFESTTDRNDALAISVRVRSESVPVTGRDDVPEALERVLRTAMAKDPRARYATALEFARTLQGIQNSLHMSMTPIDVREDRATPESDADEGDGSTRISSFVVIDPQGESETSTGRRTGPAPVPARMADPTAGPGVDFTVPPSSQRGGAVPAQAIEPVATAATDLIPVPLRQRRLVWAGFAAAVLLVAVVVVVQLVSGHGSPGTTADGRTPTSQAKPEDPVGLGLPRITGLAAVRRGAQVVVTWKNPDPHDGDGYLYRVVSPQKETPLQGPITATEVRVPADHGRTCVEVVLRRSNGQASTGKVVCAR